MVKQVIPSIQLYSGTSMLRTSTGQMTTAVINDGLLVYPNPNGTHSLTISADVGFSSRAEITIYNSLGQIAMTRNLSPADVKNKAVTFPIDLPHGLYIIKLVTSDKIYSSKFIVL